MQAPIRIALAVPLIAGVWLVSGLPAGQAPAGEFDPGVFANLSDHCIEAHRFARNHRVSLKVRNAQNEVVWSAPGDAKTDGDGFISFGREPVVGDLYCEPPSPPDLKPGMKVTIDDGTTRKELVLGDVTVDDLNHITNAATGTAPEGPHSDDDKPDLWFSAWNDGTRGTGEAEIAYHPGGAWSVDFDDMGGDVEQGGGAGINAWDEDGDATTAERLLTALSLQAASADSATSHAARTVVVERGSKVGLTGRLSAVEVSCTRRKRVKLLDVTGEQSKAVRSDRTNRRGRYSFTMRVKRTASFRVRYGGSGHCQRSLSRARTIRVAGS